jgi:hypothetical protein
MGIRCYFGWTMTEQAIKALHLTEDGAGISAFAGHVTGPAWLTYICR